MVAQIFKNKYNASRLAEKDPFEIAGIGILAKYEIVDYYRAIVSSTAHRALITSEGFDRTDMQSFGGIGTAKYFYDKETEPRVKQTSAARDAPAKNLKKGDLSFDVSADSRLDEKIKKIFSVFKDIENHDYEPMRESEVSDSELALSSKGEVVDFSFYEQKTGGKYFVFEFKNPKERKKVVKKLR
jgi:hypothetical protein